MEKKKEKESIVKRISKVQEEKKKRKERGAKVCKREREKVRAEEPP
jgi:hypothetical protein